MDIDYGKWQDEFHYSFINKKIFVEKFIGKTLKIIKFYVTMEILNIYM